jgi:5-methylthioadenosine/S-adenosylhomocysteine deaminase
VSSEAPDPATVAFEPVDLLVTGGLVVTMDPSRRLIADGAVAVRDGAIVAVGPAGELAARYVAGERRDATGCAVVPGLVNGHAHLAMSPMRGLGADLALQTWLFDCIFPAERAFVDAAYVRAGTTLSLAELIRGGTTTVVDMYYFEEEVAAAADAAGIRAICSQGILRFPTPDAADAAAGLARAERFLAEWSGHPRVMATVAPHAPYTCTADIFRQAAALCRRHGTPLVTHLSETAREVAESRAEHGLSPVAWTEATGALDGPCIAAHCVHVDAADVARLVDRRVGVVPCPSSNLKLASGIAPVAGLLAAGARVGLGTDGPASNDDQDLWTELHLAALLAKGTSGDPTALPAPEAFALATCRGAAAVHLGEKVGSLEAGKRADLVVVDLSGAHTWPQRPGNPDAIYATLVYASRSADVRDVLVDGRWLLVDGRLLTIDLDAARAGVQAYAAAIDAWQAGQPALLPKH